MATKKDKKNAIRQDIIDAAKVYSRDLAGKTFLYVYGVEFFEVSFSVERFLHLTGVETPLYAKAFYKNAKKAILNDGQFYFSQRHPYSSPFSSATVFFPSPLFRMIRAGFPTATL